MKKRKREILLYGASRFNADILYFSGAFVPDAFFAFTLEGKKCAILNALEVGRVGKSGGLDRIFDGTKVLRALLRKNSEVRPDECDVAAAVLKSAGVNALLLPWDFPSAYARRLSDCGFDVEICAGEIFPKRAVKNSDELSKIRQANAVAAKGFMAVESVLRQSEVKGGTLFWKDEPLTSQTLISQIEKIAIDSGADAVDTIAASGAQACDPHERGHGPIRANSLIVVDIFPRMRETGYFGDMTRTFLKGLPSAQQEGIVAAVAEAQKLAVDMLCDGADGMRVHSAVENFFEQRGYNTYEKNGSWRGYFHSTGHGVGLEVHEAPSLGRSECILKKGNVVTVEPGLYYPEIGGCRIEDTLAITKGGVKYLSEYGYNWIIE